MAAKIIAKDISPLLDNAFRSAHWNLLTKIRSAGDQKMPKFRPIINNRDKLQLRPLWLLHSMRPYQILDKSTSM